MITEDYVSFEVAKLLKEKGFDVPCYGRYSILSKSFYIDAIRRCTNNENLLVVSAPTLQMACRWLREEKHFYIQIMLDSWALGSHSGYYIVIQATNSDFKEISPRINEEDTVFFSTYEEAVEAAIKYVLENLI